MYRTMSATVIALMLGAPAYAQSAGELSGGAWSCRMTSLVGEPGGDLTLDFGPTGSLSGEFYFEIPDEDDTIAMRFTVTGGWTLDGSVISMNVTDSELIGAWLNGEELPDDTKEAMQGSLEEELEAFSGEDTVAYIAEHAMVLEEPDTSISCWR